MSSGLISSHFTRRIARAIACTPQDVVDQTLAAVSGDSLDILQQKNSELRATLQRLQWPRLLRFHSGGETHELPVRSQSEASLVSAAAEERLQYLAGFFDGDGCVHAQISGCALSVTQSFDQADILMLYRATLGGSIVKLCDGRGLQRPSLRWTISGPAARRAAHLLAPYSITKHKQLLLATDWPDETSGRQACRVELSSLKRFDSAVARQCSLEYLTGFFDAEGYIQPIAMAAVQLQIGQRFGTVLSCLQQMLAHNLGMQASLYHYASRSVLCIHGTSDAKDALRAMVGVGMLCKAEQAELAMSLTPQNAATVCQDLACRVGNQRYGNRQDLAGRARAQKLSKMQARARAGLLKDAQLQELDKFRSEHALLNAQHANRELQDFMHKVQNLSGECWEVK